MRTLALASLLLLDACRTADKPDDSGLDSIPGEQYDRDGDGYDESEDCDDDDASINPGADEVCDDVDNDCDGDVDDEDDDVTGGTTWYLDGDRDGYGADDTTRQACDPPEGWADQGGDCDDSDPRYHPGAEESCTDPYDYNCDGSIGYADEDGDGYAACEECDDSDPDVHPGATELCNGVDDDCDGAIDEDFDLDGDGFLGAECEGDDCDDADPTIHPGADEVCDGVDQDCDGEVDEDPLDGDWYYADEDGDSFGDPLGLVLACSGPENDWDCNDADATEPQVVDVSASSTTSDGTAAHPWTTIQEGIDGADECVVVYGGTYHENVDFGGKGVRVTGVEGRDATVIEGESSDAAVVTFASAEGADAELTGFTLTNGGGYGEYFEDSYTCGSASWTCYTYTWTWCGGGVFVDGATPTLSDLTISENILPESTSWTKGIIYFYYEYSYGGGLCARDATLTLVDVDVTGNYADQGGGAWIDEDSDVTWTGSLFQANGSTDGGAFQLDGGELSLTNVLSAWNEASDDGGGVLVLDGLLTEVNVTHGGDDAAIGGGLYLSGTSTASVMNTIIWGAATGEGVYGDSTATFSGLYNDVYGNAGGEYSGVTNPTGTSGNISWDPEFTDVTEDGDPTNDDWTLSETSICVDAGNSATRYNDADGTRNDMGAYGGPGGGWTY